MICISRHERDRVRLSYNCSASYISDTELALQDHVTAD